MGLGGLGGLGVSGLRGLGADPAGERVYGLVLWFGFALGDQTQNLRRSPLACMVWVVGPPRKSCRGTPPAPLSPRVSGV